MIMSVLNSLAWFIVASYTHDIAPSVIHGWIRIGFPLLSRGTLISKTCNADAIFSKSIDSAKYLPGHILERQCYETQYTVDLRRVD